MNVESTQTPPKALESLQSKKDCLVAFADQVKEMEAYLRQVHKVVAIVQASVDDPENEQLHQEATRAMIAHIIRISLDAGRPEVVTAMLQGDFKAAMKAAAE